MTPGATSSDQVKTSRHPMNDHPKTASTIAHKQSVYRVGGMTRDMLASVACSQGLKKKSLATCEASTKRKSDLLTLCGRALLGSACLGRACGRSRLWLGDFDAHDLRRIVRAVVAVARKARDLL